MTHVQINQKIVGQQTLPNDADYLRGSQANLDQIDLPDMWDESIGSLNTVVAVLDTGIDIAHRDLYLNIWLNQGELPTAYLDNVGPRLTDIDGDGLITFYDLNNVTRGLTSPFSLSIPVSLRDPC